MRGAALSYRQTKQLVGKLFYVPLFATVVGVRRAFRTETSGQSGIGPFLFLLWKFAREFVYLEKRFVYGPYFQ